MNINTKEPIYIIIPVYNRKAITLKCLETLSQNGDLQRYYVVVIDDGSTDGTTEAIHSLYPDVIVLAGDGNLWWTGAIKKGMEYAYNQNAQYIIWLNDDTLPSKEAIPKIVKTCFCNPQKILSAQCYSSLGTSSQPQSNLKVPTYGGSRKSLFNAVPVYASLSNSKSCDFLHGNLTCIPRSVIDKIGYPPADKIPHYHGETIYTWKAKQAGYTLEILGCATAICEKNPGDSSWLTSDIPVIERWKSLLTPKSPFYYRGYWHFCLTFWGIWGILIYIKPYLRLTLIALLRWIFPKPLLKSFKQPI